MATQEQCHEALQSLSRRLAGAGDEQQRALLDRTVSCRVPDLGVVYSGRLGPDGLSGITTDPAPQAQIRLTVASDDLLALTDGRLPFGSAWARGQVKVDASIRDLFKLRSLL